MNKEIEEAILKGKKQSKVTKELTKAELDIQAIIAENEALKKEKEERDTKEKKEVDPMSGLGELCECYKINVADAWQIRRVQSQDGSRMILEPAPDGYRIKKGANGFYVVDCDAKDPQSCPYLPSCRSKYTKEYEYKLPKPAHYRVDQEPPKGKIHLCEKHAGILLGK